MAAQIPLYRNKNCGTQDLPHVAYYVHFVGVSSPERANASGIILGLKETLVANMGKDWDNVIKKTVGLSCDGASVMVGCRNGVSTTLKEAQPSLVTIHCMAHRLELALKDCMKRVRYFERCSNLLMGISIGSY